METLSFEYSPIDYVAGSAWILGIVGMSVAMNLMHRNPSILVRIGIISTVLLIFGPAIALRRESVWWTCVFVIGHCFISYGMWKKYRKTRIEPNKD
jgi:TRAP-type uncharacterized transport system fused permease subunit